MQLYLIRHPAPQVAPDVCYGRTDLPLAEPVAAAAARIKPRLPPQLPIYTSPLQRCRQLADALHPAPQHDPRLQEMNFGIWEMHPWQTLDQDALNGWAADPLGYVPSQGESVGQVRTRVMNFLRQAMDQGIERAALVTHAGVMKVIVGHARGIPEEQWMSLRFEYESVVCVTISQAR